MTANVHKTALLGELVAAAFDGAASYSTDPDEVSRLAATAVMHVLLRTSRVAASPAPWTEGRAPWLVLDHAAAYTAVNHAQRLAALRLERGHS